MASRYAERKKVINAVREKHYIDEVMKSDYIQDCSDYVNTDLLPRIEKTRTEIARLQAELDSLESEYRCYLKEDNDHYSMVYDYKTDFESKLTEAQIQALLPVVNRLVFSDKQTVETMHKWLACNNQMPIRVKDVAALCYMLNLLRDNGYICGNAHKVAEDNETFIGGRGAIITQKSLTVSLNKKKDRDENGLYIDPDQIINKEIYDVIGEIKTIKE